MTRRGYCPDPGFEALSALAAFLGRFCIGALLWGRFVDFDPLESIRSDGDGGEVFFLTRWIRLRPIPTGFPPLGLAHATDARAVLAYFGFLGPLAFRRLIDD